MPSDRSLSPRPLFAAQALRQATAAAHEEVDAVFSRVDLSDPAGYRAFLVAQAGAHLPVEAGLDAADATRVFPDWPQRRRAALLRADLADLGLIAETAEPPVLADDAEVAGAAYVLEGSRLGGAMLRRMVADGAPARFLAAPAEPGAWRALLLRLDVLLADPADLARAVIAARGAFARFADAGHAMMAPAHG